jgi:transcriptional regulator of met regulon
MTDKARLSQAASKLSGKPKRTAGTPKRSLIANAPHGEKGDYVKVTVTLPPEVYELLATEATRRKVHKEANPQLSAVIREAVVAFLR